MSAEPAIPPQEFARTVLAAFEAADRTSDVEIDIAGGPSSTTMTKYRHVAAGDATMREPRGDTYRAIDAAANWVPGSARSLWRRGSPPVEAEITAAEEMALEEVRRLSAELADLRRKMARLERDRESQLEHKNSEKHGESA